MAECTLNTVLCAVADLLLQVKARLHITHCHEHCKPNNIFSG